MPALAENIEMKHVHLEMYLRQPNAAYRLQVGIWEDETGDFVPMATFNNSTTGVELVECDFSVLCPIIIRYVKTIPPPPRPAGS